MNKAVHILSESVKRAIIVKVGSGLFRRKYKIKKPDGTYDPKEFSNAKDAIEYRNYAYYNKGKVAKGQRRIQDLGGSGKEYEVKTTGKLPKRGPDGKLYTLDSSGRRRTYSSYSDFLRKNKRNLSRDLTYSSGQVTGFLNSAANLRVLFKLSTWGIILQTVIHWHNEVDAIHELYKAKEIDKAEAEGAVRDITEKAIAGGVMALAGGTLIKAAGYTFIKSFQHLFRLSPATVNWLNFATDTVQKQVLAYAINNEYVGEDFMRALLRFAYVGAGFGLLASFFNDMLGAGKITQDLEDLRNQTQDRPGGSNQRSQGPRDSNTPTSGTNTAASAGGAVKPDDENSIRLPQIVDIDRPPQIVNIDWQRDSPAEIERKLKKQNN